MAKAADPARGRRIALISGMSVLLLCVTVIAGLGIAELYLSLARLLGDSSVAIVFLALLLGTAASLIRPERLLRD